MNYKDKFINIFNQHIKREGSSKLLDYLFSESSDFFDAPASTRYHGSYKGGLVEHSVNVYECLNDYIKRERAKDVFFLSYEAESIAIVSLLHDLCKINCYKTGYRNVKGEDGKWKKVQVYEYDDNLPYGHGEKSVYIITGFMRLTREESFAIRYHMGFSGNENPQNISASFTQYPLSLALFIADMEATFFMESKKES